LHCSIYFPHTDENESSDGGKTSEEAKAVADAPEATTTTPQVQESSSTDKLEIVSNQDDTIDNQHEAEPEAKKIKSSRDTDETTEASDEDWQKIERGAVPHKVTIEDVVDESEIDNSQD
jgi:hypothetical protein